MALDFKLTNTLVCTLWVLFSCFFTSCNQIESKEDAKISKSSKVRFNYAVFNNKPQFEDEYLYDSKLKDGLKISADSITWYHIDWNENGSYFDIGIDYFGVKSISDAKPVISLLGNENIINCNGYSYKVAKSDSFRVPHLLKKQQPSSLSYINRFVDIKLDNGQTISKKVLTGYDKTVIYFWASWCKPCIEKLNYYNQNKEMLALKNIQVIPIYANSSQKSIEVVIKKKGFEFEPLGISSESAKYFRLYALPQSYTFNEGGVLIK